MRAIEAVRASRAGLPPRRDLFVASLAHVLHDGYTDLLYVLLPIWQAEYALGYATLAIMRALYYGAMAAGQVPTTRWFGRLGAPVLLAGGTVMAALGFVVAGVTTSFVGLCVGLIIGGLGSSTQHPYASELVTHAYGEEARGPLGIYNFAGDLGKAIFPALMALLLIVMAWRGAALVVALIGLVVAAAIYALLPRAAQRLRPADEAKQGTGKRGFAILFALGALDTACRMGYLLFLPFILKARGGTEQVVGLALALVFIGGALGKAMCGWLGARIGLLGTVAVTETATAALMVVTLLLPVTPILLVLPLLGVMLNGTSSVLYGTVPEFASPGRTAHMFAVFYTGVIGAGALAPIGYGAFADFAGRASGVWAAAASALATLPLAAVLARRLRDV